MAKRNSSEPIARVVAALALLVWSAFALTSARAETPPAFVIADVRVDETAATATEAREVALAAGQRKAFRRLLERLTPRSQHDRLQRLSAQQVSDLVENFEVQSERTSSVRYIAMLTVRFNPDGVRALLRRAGIPFAETYARPLVVLPVYRGGGTTVLWDEPNPWFAAWRTLPPNDGLQPLIVPLGDLEDIGAVNVEQALRGEPAAIAAIAGKYGAGGAVVASAAVDSGSDGRTLAHISVTRLDPVVADQTVVASYTAAADEDATALLARAAARTAQAIEERWKSELTTQFGQAATILADVSFGELAEWVALRERLARTAAIHKTEVLNLSRRHARLELHYVGSQTALRLALAQNDLVLDQGAEMWQLSLRRAGDGSVGSNRP